MKLDNRFVIPNALLALALAVGCQDDSQLLKREMAKVKQSVNSKLDAISKRESKIETSAKGLEEQQSELKEQWEAFSLAYSPEVRSELEKNLDMAKQELSEIKRIRDTATGLLQELEQLVTDSKQFRDRAEKHSVDARDFDKIGILESSIASIKSKISNLENDVQEAKRDASAAKRKASSAENRARRAESKARRR